MIGTVCVEIQGKFPAMPLDPMQAFVGSPSSIRVRNVPKKIGDWQITSVKFVVVYPDASIKNTTCRLVGGVWVGTVEGTLTSGTSKNGYSIFADGIDENGNDVVGYCLGKGDVEILKADGTIDPDAPAFYVKLLEEQSEDPKPGEMWFNDGELNIVDANGDVQTFGQPDLSDYRTKLDLDVYEKVIAPWTWTGVGREFVWDQTEGRWVFADSDGTTYGIYFNISNSTWHFQLLGDEWTDVNTPIEAASDVLELEFMETRTFTRPYVENTHATSDKLAKVSQLPNMNNYATKTELNAKQNKIFANGILRGDGQGNISAADMSNYRQKLDLSVYQQTYTRWTILRDNVDVTNQVQQPVYGDWGGEMGWQCFNCVLPGENILEGGFQPDVPEDALELQLITQGDTIYDYYLTRTVSGVTPTQDTIATNSSVSSAIQSKRDYTDLSMPPPYNTDYWTRDDNGWFFEKVGENHWDYDEGTATLTFSLDTWTYDNEGDAADCSGTSSDTVLTFNLSGTTITLHRAIPNDVLISKGQVQAYVDTQIGQVLTEAF